ncbi:MAG: hypothetical protein K0R75_1361 [Paenibacillaceae bacterium]|jgi:hypothetical protein|nr:hypothetical protein [Paenibacillaceae bacterium]
MSDLIKYYILNIPIPLYVVGIVFVALLLCIRWYAGVETRENNK